MKLWSFGATLLTSALPLLGQTNAGKIKPAAASQNTNVVFSSGIRGSIVAGPITPVERPGVPSTRPLAEGIIIVQSVQDRHEIARQKADSSGHFQIALPPGKYFVAPQAPHHEQPFPRSKPQQVMVETNKFTEVTVQFDTGIR